MEIDRDRAKYIYINTHNNWPPCSSQRCVARSDQPGYMLQQLRKAHNTQNTYCMHARARDIYTHYTYILYTHKLYIHQVKGFPSTYSILLILVIIVVIVIVIVIVVVIVIIVIVVLIVNFIVVIIITYSENFVHRIFIISQIRTTV